MKTLQLRTRRYEEVIEWIPYDGLSNVEKIGKGGICPLYSAILSDDIQKIKVYNYSYKIHVNKAALLHSRY